MSMEMELGIDWSSTWNIPMELAYEELWREAQERGEMVRLGRESWMKMPTEVQGKSWNQIAGPWVPILKLYCRSMADWALFFAKYLSIYIYIYILKIEKNQRKLLKYWTLVLFDSQSTLFLSKMLKYIFKFLILI
jgi:hypothetical protein